MVLVYYHGFVTFTSSLLTGKGDKQQQIKDVKKNVISLHWVTQMFGHEQLIKS